MQNWFLGYSSKRHGYLFRRIHLSTRSQQRSINNPSLLSSWECPLRSFYLSCNHSSFWKPTLFSQPLLGNDNAFHRFVGTKRSLPCKPTGLCLPPSKTQRILFFLFLVLWGWASALSGINLSRLIFKWKAGGECPRETSTSYWLFLGYPHFSLSAHLAFGKGMNKKVKVLYGE